MKAIYKKPGEPAEIVDIENTPQAIRAARPGPLPPQRGSAGSQCKQHRLCHPGGAGAADGRQRVPDAGCQGHAGRGDCGGIPKCPSGGQGKPHELSGGAGPLQRESEKAIRPGRAHIHLRQMRYRQVKEILIEILKELKIIRRHLEDLNGGKQYRAGQRFNF